MRYINKYTRNKMRPLTATVAIALTLASTLSAQTEVKRVLKGSMKLVYKVKPQNVDNFWDMFSDGVFYGRFRINSFINKPDHETATRKSTWTAGFGGSLIYKSAYFHGVGMTAGLYTSQNPWHISQSEVPYLKGDRETFSRYDAMKTGNFNMTVLAQAYLEYKIAKSDFKLGRQIFESRLTASNDTKMIPNTFEGISYTGRNFSKTKIKLAYFTRQKLRDHTTFHDILSYDSSNTAEYSQWTENDDPAMHKGLTTAKLQAKGIHSRLIVAQVDNHSIKNLKLMLNYTAVPKLVSSATIDAYYAIHLPDRFVLIPGVRYMQQFDNGAGAIGGANLKANATDYKDPNSVNGKLYGARLDLRRAGFLGRVGYTYIADEGDLIAPWRGYPTGGFTRAMAQYNWYANTKSYMLRLGYNFRQMGINTFARYAIQDFDNAKPGTPADHNAIEWNITKTFASLPDLYLKARAEYVSYKSGIHDINGAVKSSPSYGDYRLEVNYLF
jgi:hypothetical protein